MQFNVHSAREYAGCGKTEDWIYAYLAAGEWANPGLLNGLKLAPRWWVGPIELPLSRLFRKCGPEADMEYRMPIDGWNTRVGRIVLSISDPLLLPPLIAEWCVDRLVLADGSHRHEAAVRKGWATIYTWIWFNSEDQWRASEWFRAGG